MQADDPRLAGGDAGIVAMLAGIVAQAPRGQGGRRRAEDSVRPRHFLPAFPSEEFPPQKGAPTGIRCTRG